MGLEHLNDETFEKTITEANGVVLVDFFATWCGPCKMLSPILQATQEELADKAKIYKLDIDEGMNTAKQFGVMSVPTMIIFKHGEEVDRLVGLRQKSQIIAAIEAKL